MGFGTQQGREGKSCRRGTGVRKFLPFPNVPLNIQNTNPTSSNCSVLVRSNSKSSNRICLSTSRHTGPTLNSDCLLPPLQHPDFRSPFPIQVMAVQPRRQKTTSAFVHGSKLKKKLPSWLIHFLPRRSHVEAKVLGRGRNESENLLRDQGLNDISRLLLLLLRSRVHLLPQLPYLHPQRRIPRLLLSLSREDGSVFLWELQAHERMFLRLDLGRTRRVIAD